MTITTQFVTEATLGSWAIRFGTHSDFSHVDVVLPSGDLLGARSAGGVQIRKPDYTQFSLIRRVVIPCSDDEGQAYYEFLRAQVGKPYDWKGVVGFAVNRDWRATDCWFCSELDIAAKEVAKIIKVATPASRITPNDDYLLSASISSSVY